MVKSESENSGTIPDKEQNEFLTLYQVSAQEIASFKEQQWKVTNYGLLLYAAIIGIPKLLPGPQYKWESVVFFLISFSVLVVGIFLICQLDKALSEARGRVSRSRYSLSEKFFEASTGIKKDDPSSARIEDSLSLAPLFYGVFVVGFFISSWFLYRLSCGP